MNARGLRRYVEDLLRGRRPRPFRPDDFEAAQIRMIESVRRLESEGEIDLSAVTSTSQDEVLV